MKNELTLKEIQNMTGGDLIGDGEIKIKSVSSMENYVSGSISPLWEKKFAAQALPEMILLTKPGWIMENGTGIEVNDPRKALNMLLEFFNPYKFEEPFISPTATISETSTVGDSVYIGPNCVISDEACLGNNVLILGNAWIGKSAKIGDGTRIEQGAIIHDFVKVGKNCIIHSNAVIGSEGFGFIPNEENELIKVPQIGSVVIEDDVEIGTCACIDRATFGETLISKGTKIDALVKVGHNCRIGSNCILVSQSGVAGSSVLEDHVILAAQSGVGNHARIGTGTTIAARAGVIGDIPPHKIYSGFPAQEHKKELRQLGALRNLTNLISEVKNLKRNIEEVKKKGSKNDNDQK